VAIETAGTWHHQAVELVQQLFAKSGTQVNISLTCRQFHTLLVSFR